MLKFLVILLDNSSIFYCHANTRKYERNLISLETLKNAILFSMKHNLAVQYVMPDYDLSEVYLNLMNSVDNIKIGADIEIYHSIPESVNTSTVVLCISINEFIQRTNDVINIIEKSNRVTINFTDIEKFSDSMISSYQEKLDCLVDFIINELVKGRKHDVNILTDRVDLNRMENCGAGISNITLAPNGNFYLCPAFYFDELNGIDSGMDYKTINTKRSVGNLEDGICIKNAQMLSLEYSPICKICDSYHCNRCIWLNQKLTLELNTPSRQQCIMSHIERNASRKLAKQMNKYKLQVVDIPEIDYLDPFVKFLN